MMKKLNQEIREAYIFLRQNNNSISDEVLNLMLEASLNYVNEESLTIPDIRNKLSPITHLVSMLERDRIQYAKDSLEEVKKSINYLAKREVY